MIYGAGGRHSSSIFSQHRYMCCAHAVQGWGDVIILGFMALVTAYQAPDVIRKALLSEILYHLNKHRNETF